MNYEKPSYTYDLGSVFFTSFKVLSLSSVLQEKNDHQKILNFLEPHNHHEPLTLSMIWFWYAMISRSSAADGSNVMLSGLFRTENTCG